MLPAALHDQAPVVTLSWEELSGACQPVQDWGPAQMQPIRMGCSSPREVSRPGARLVMRMLQEALSLMENMDAWWLKP